MFVLLNFAGDQTESCILAIALTSTLKSEDFGSEKLQPLQISAMANLFLTISLLPLGYDG